MEERKIQMEWKDETKEESVVGRILEGKRGGRDEIKETLHFIIMSRGNYE